jgi:hypothetical protein
MDLCIDLWVRNEACTSCKSGVWSSSAHLFVEGWLKPHLGDVQIGEVLFKQCKQYTSVCTLSPRFHASLDPKFYCESIQSCLKSKVLAF